MYRIDEYTGRWDEGSCWGRPSGPRLGSTVRIYEGCDDRQYNGFCDALRRAGKTIDYIRWMPKARCNVYRIVKAGECRSF